MQYLVTGAAGFIGSTLAEELLASGHTVRCVDSFEDYYDRHLKEANSARLRSASGVSFLEQNLLDCDLDTLLDGVDVVFHLAATPGVRASWGAGFDAYVRNNVRATERLLFACKDRPLARFVYASSSSVYGNTQDLPLRETSLPRPFSPYGVTKLAGENLCLAYGSNYALPVVALRFFSVYGPRQRPDMGFNKFIRAALRGDAVPVYGDGSQTRDFTFVGDVVQALLRAAERDGLAGQVINVGGGSRVTVMQTLDIIEEALGRPVRRDRLPNQKGDVRDTQADTTRMQELLGFTPATGIHEGLRLEVDWMRQALAAGEKAASQH